MSLGAVGLQPGQLVSQAQKLVEQSPNQVHEFDQVLSRLEQNPQGQGLVQQAAQQQGPAKIIGPEQTQGLYAQKLEQAKEPGGVRKLLGEVEAGTNRLQDLIGQIQGGKTFSPQELLGVQAEIQNVSLQVETTTKVVSEVVSNVKQLMQQQI